MRRDHIKSLYAARELAKEAFVVIPELIQKLQHSRDRDLSSIETARCHRKRIQTTIGYPFFQRIHTCGRIARYSGIKKPAASPFSIQVSDCQGKQQNRTRPSAVPLRNQDERKTSTRYMRIRTKNNNQQAHEKKNCSLRAWSKFWS